GAAQDGRRDADGVPGLRQVGARRPHLRARADHGDERGGGRRTRVWIDGIAEPILAGRTERTILHDMGQDAATATVVLDDALDLAERVAKAVDEGPLDLRDLGRRARRVLEKTAKPAEPEQSF